MTGRNRAPACSEQTSRAASVGRRTFAWPGRTFAAAPKSASEIALLELIPFRLPRARHPRASVVEERTRPGAVARFRVVPEVEIEAVASQLSGAVQPAAARPVVERHFSDGGVAAEHQR